MNKTTAALVATIVLLVAALAFTLGRNSSDETPLATASEGSLPSQAAEQSTVNAATEVAPAAGAAAAAVQPAAVTTEVGNWGKGNSVTGNCSVSTNGYQVMNGSCSGASRPTDIVLTAESNGCTVELNKVPGGASAKIYGYRDSCWLNEESGLELEGDVLLGKLKFQGGCWVGDQVRLCVK